MHNTVGIRSVARQAGIFFVEMILSGAQSGNNDPLEFAPFGGNSQSGRYLSIYIASEHQTRTYNKICLLA